MADSHSNADLKKHLRLYTIIGATLFLFTGITVWISYVDFGHTYVNVAIGLSIATFKASLVALIFMHLNHEKAMIYRILVFTGFFASALMLLFVLALKDPIVL